MDIGQAVQALKERKKVARAGWDEQGMWLAYYPALVISNTDWLAFVVIRTPQGEYVPWTCSQADLLANDWVMVTEWSAADAETA
jgi:hypothetical protein